MFKFAREWVYIAWRTWRRKFILFKLISIVSRIFYHHLDPPCPRRRTADVSVQFRLHITGLDAMSHGIYAIWTLFLMSSSSLQWRELEEARKKVQIAIFFPIIVSTRGCVYSSSSRWWVTRPWYLGDVSFTADDGILKLNQIITSQTRHSSIFIPLRWSVPSPPTNVTSCKLRIDSKSIYIMTYTKNQESKIAPAYAGIHLVNNFSCYFGIGNNKYTASVLLFKDEQVTRAIMSGRPRLFASGSARSTLGSWSWGHKRTLEKGRTLGEAMTMTA